MGRFDETIVSLNQQLVNGEITAVDLVKQTIQRIKDLDTDYHAFLTLDEEGALKAAEKSDQKGYSTDRPLQGIPVGIKDNIITEGVETTASSHILEGFIPVYQSAVMEKLEAAGAIMIGKLNLDEFAMGSSTETSYFGPSRNPWNLERVPGGSSGGSAAAVAGGEVVASLGSDTGGSIRQPASYNGIVGMKPTYGRVSRWGLIAFGSSLDQIGPMTRTVEDNAILLQAISGLDERDSTTADIEVPDFTAKLKNGVKGLRIAVPEVKMRIMLGTFSLSSGYFDAYYKKAGRVRTLIRRQFEELFVNYDIVAGPVTTSTAFAFGEKSADPIEMYMADLLTVPVNLAGLPSISVPCGFDDENLPIGLQLIGNYFDESTLYQAAYAYEQATDYHTKHPE